MKKFLLIAFMAMALQNCAVIVGEAWENSKESFPTLGSANLAYQDHPEVKAARAMGDADREYYRLQAAKYVAYCRGNPNAYGCATANGPAQIRTIPGWQNPPPGWRVRSQQGHVPYHLQSPPPPRW